MFQLQFAHHLKHWTFNFLIFETIYSLPKIDFEKCCRFYLKARVYVVVKFQVPNCHVNQLNFPSCLLSHDCMFSSLLHSDHFSSFKLMAFSSYLSSCSYEMSNVRRQSFGDADGMSLHLANLEQLNNKVTFHACQKLCMPWQLELV